MNSCILLFKIKSDSFIICCFNMLGANSSFILCPTYPVMLSGIISKHLWELKWLPVYSHLSLRKKGVNVIIYPGCKFSLSCTEKYEIHFLNLHIFNVHVHVYWIYWYVKIPQEALSLVTVRSLHCSAIVAILYKLLLDNQRSYQMSISNFA